MGNFTVEVLTLRELVTYYVLFFIHLEPKGGDRRDHQPPDRAVDDASGSERHHGTMRRAWKQPLSPARSRHELHSFLLGNH